MKNLRKIALTAALLFALPLLNGQQSSEPRMQVPKVVPVPPLHPTAPAKEPTNPPARDVRDALDHLILHLPAGWNFTRKDGELSTFHLDARTAPRKSRLHIAANLAYNPYPLSTFSGAIFYVSSTAGLSAADCAAETTTKPFDPLPPGLVDKQTFARGKDEHGQICTEARDVAYTALRNKSCLRFDLAVNTFCGGEVSGAEELTANQLQSIYTRLTTILDSVRFTP